jgi:hypothetical protein
LLLLFAALVSVACVVASARRLAIAVAPSWLDAGVLLERLKAGATKDDIANAAAAEPRAEWTAALVEATKRQHGPARTALVNEQLLEIDHETQRMARVPRVCASVCTSAGFLLAALSIRASLEAPEVFAEATRSAALRDAVTTAIDIGAIGVCGTAFCIAIHVAARRAARRSHDDIDRLVDALEKA